MAEEECTHFGITAEILAKFSIEVATSHGAQFILSFAASFFPPNSALYF
jgi:hypothetical protein